MADEKNPPDNLNRSPYIVMPELSGGSGGGNWGSKMTSGLSGPHRNLVLLILGGLVILGLAALGGYLLVGDRGGDEPQTTPQIVVEPSDDDANEAAADTDRDGLIDSEEAQRGTDVNNPDSDSDGLADGDEIAVYGTDPRQPDSDGDGFDDGPEVGRGYSPLANSPSQADGAERQSWLVKSLSYGLHEPTISTLAAYQATDSSRESTQATVYTNSFYKYRIEYDPVLSLREERSGQVVGLTVSGSEPAEEISLEPFVIGLAGSKAAATLAEWVSTQFSAEEYDIQEVSLNGAAAVKVSEKQSSDCRQVKTFVTNNNVILSIAWTCGSPAALAPYYEQIVNSFIFVP